MRETRCSICQSAPLSVFLEMPDVPVHCNLLWTTHAAAVEAPRGNIHLGFCMACGMIYNISFDPGLVSYTQEYENSLHCSPRFQQYATELATRLVETYRLHGKDVLDIGCGKGEFLALLCAAGGSRGIGFDTSYDGSRGETGEADVTIIQDYDSEAYADCKADLICCRHVLEHIHAPRTFMAHIRQAVGRRTAAAVFFEVPNALYTLRHMGIWDIIYEHCSYFSIPSLARLFRETGFVPHDIYTTFGEQFLCLEASVPGSMAATETDFAPAIDALRGLVESFAEHYYAKVDLWKRHLNRLFAAGKRVVVWGAGSKGVTFLNTIEGADRISHVIDLNPRKQGMYVAGTGQRIMSPAWLSESGADTVLIMNPLYKDEIQEKIAQLGLMADMIVV